MYFQVITSESIACNQTSFARDFFFPMPHIWVFFVGYTCMTHTRPTWTWIIPELIFIRFINWNTFCSFRLEIYRIRSFSSSWSTKLGSDWLLKRRIWLALRINESKWWTDPDMSFYFSTSSSRFFFSSKLFKLVTSHNFFESFFLDSSKYFCSYFGDNIILVPKYWWQRPITNISNLVTKKIPSSNWWHQCCTIFSGCPLVTIGWLLLNFFEYIQKSIEFFE